MALNARRAGAAFEPQRAQVAQTASDRQPCASSTRSGDPARGQDGTPAPPRRHGLAHGAPDGAETATLGARRAGGRGHTGPTWTRTTASPPAARRRCAAHPPWRPAPNPGTTQAREEPGSALASTGRGKTFQLDVPTSYDWTAWPTASSTLASARLASSRPFPIRPWCSSTAPGSVARRRSHSRSGESAATRTSASTTTRRSRRRAGHGQPGPPPRSAPRGQPGRGSSIGAASPSARRGLLLRRPQLHRTVASGRDAVPGRPVCGTPPRGTCPPGIGHGGFGTASTPPCRTAAPRDEVVASLRRAASPRMQRSPCGQDTGKPPAGTEGRCRGHGRAGRAEAAGRSVVAARLQQRPALPTGRCRNGRPRAGFRQRRCLRAEFQSTRASRTRSSSR